MNALFWSQDNQFSDNLTVAVVIICNGPTQCWACQQSVLCWAGTMVP